LIKTWLTFQTIRRGLKVGANARRWVRLSLLKAKRLSEGSKPLWQELEVVSPRLLLLPLLFLCQKVSLLLRQFAHTRQLYL
jgi:hypothetical protein